MTMTKNKWFEAQMGNDAERFVYFNGHLMEFEMPLEIDLQDIFDNRMTIKVNHSAKYGSYIGVDISINGKTYGIIGKVLRVKSRGMMYELTLNIEYFPDDLLFELEDIFENEVY